MADRVLVHDISKWQSDLSHYWQMFKDKSCKAVIIKATEGYAYYDYFRDTVKIAKEQGFLVGSYHYFRQQIKNVEGTWISCDPVRQAQNYFDWVGKCGVKTDLPPVIDLENGNNPFLNAGTIDKFLIKTEALWQRTPMIYSSPSVLKYSVGNPAHWGRYPLWLAHYAETPVVPAPWKDYKLWQFSDKITYNLLDKTGNIVARKPIDHNWFNGSYEDLLKFCELGEAPIPDPVDPDAPKQVETTVNLRGRTTPVYIEGDSALVFKKGTVLDVVNEPEVYEASSGITWIPTKIYVSKKFVTGV
jgi:GH25 family lysozyme M1 (1,4-beta-N-acetylmuramidase)